MGNSEKGVKVVRGSNTTEEGRGVDMVFREVELEVLNHVKLGRGDSISISHCKGKPGF